MTRSVCPIGKENWVLTSRSRITTPTVSVAEDYYKNKAAQVLKGRVVKTPKLWGVTVTERHSELQITNERKKNIWIIIKTSPFLKTISVGKQNQSVKKRRLCWNGLCSVQGLAVNFHVSKYRLKEESNIVTRTNYPYLIVSNSRRSNCVS